MFARCLAGVDVDRHQGFGLVDDDVATRWQCDGWREQGVEVAFHLVLGKQRLVFAVELDVLGVGRHEHFHEVLGFTIGLITFDDHFIHIFGI